MSKMWKSKKTIGVQMPPPLQIQPNISPKQKCTRTCFVGSYPDIGIYTVSCNCVPIVLPIQGGGSGAACIQAIHISLIPKGIMCFTMNQYPGNTYIIDFTMRSVVCTMNYYPGNRYIDDVAMNSVVFTMTQDPGNTYIIDKLRNSVSWFLKLISIQAIRRSLFFP